MAEQAKTAHVSPRATPGLLTSHAAGCLSISSSSNARSVSVSTTMAPRALVCLNLGVSLSGYSLFMWCRLRHGLQQQFRRWRLVARSLQQLRISAALVSRNRRSARYRCVRLPRTRRVLHLLQKLDEPWVRVAFRCWLVHWACVRFTST
jgi:hypothetical protein